MMDVSKLEFNNKSVGLIVRSLAAEAHDFALARGVPSHSIEYQLPLVFSVIGSHSGHLLDSVDIPAASATDLAGIQIFFSNEGYSLLANAAKDRAACPVNADTGRI